MTIFLFSSCLVFFLGYGEREIRAGNCICRNRNGNGKWDRKAHGVRKEYEYQIRYVTFASQGI
jgi:hypothetical protein